MPLLDIPNREQLDGPARDALESVLANLIGYLYTEHDDEGSHGDVTADSVTLREAGAVGFDEGSSLHEDAGLVVESVGGPLDVYVTQPDGTREQRASFGADPQDGQTGREDQFHYALAARALRLHPQSSYNPTSNDTSALIESSQDSPRYSVYRITGSAENIEGIFTSGFSPVGGQRGQLLVLINNTGGTLSLANLGAVTDDKKIIGGPVAVADDGAIVVVYDDENRGWQILSAQKRIVPESEWNTAKIPRTLFSRNGSDQNVSTGATNVFDKTIPANTFDTNGQSIHWVASGSWTANGNTKTVDPQFNGNTLIALGPAIINTAGARWYFDLHIHRANSSFAGWVGHFVTHNAAGAIVTNSVFGSDAAMDWTVDIDLDLFLTGGATGDVLVNYSKVVFYPEGT